MKGMILAAGFGTRLGLLSDQKPKPMLPVGNLELILYTIDMMKNAGITEIAINVHHMGDQLQALIGNGDKYGVSVYWSKEEDKILGTGGGIKKIASFFGDEPVVVCNGKIISDVDLNSVIELHNKNGSMATMVLKPDKNASKWGSVGSDSSGLLNSFLGQNKEGKKVESAPNMFTGVSIIEREFIDYLPDGASCMVRQGYKPLFKSGAILSGFIMDRENYWWEHSTPERYLQGNMNLFEDYFLEKNILKFNNRSSDYPSVKEARYVIAGENIQIKSGAIIGKNVVIGDDVIIESGINIENSVIWSKCHVTEDLVSSIATPRGVIKVDLTREAGFTGPELKR